MIGDQDDLVTLINDFKRLDHDSMGSSLWVVTLFLDRNARADRVVQENWPDKSKAIVTITHRTRIDLSRRLPNANAEDKGSVGNALPERLRFAPFGVHVVRVEITCLPCMKDYISFRDRSPEGLARTSNLVILEENFDGQSSLQFQYAEPPRIDARRANLSSCFTNEYACPFEGNHMEPQSRVSADGCNGAALWRAPCGR